MLTNFASQELPDQAAEQAALDRLIEEAQVEMNTVDGMHRLDVPLEAYDWLTDDLEFATEPEPPSDVADARFLQRADTDRDGAITGYTFQYMELYHDAENSLGGRILDIGHYATSEEAGKVNNLVQESIRDGTLGPADFPGLAQELADANGLPRDAWQVATPADHQRFAEQALDTTNRDVPPEILVSDQAFTGNLFRETVADPEQAGQEQSRLANEQALAALWGIGLSVQTDFNLARDSFYDAASGERIINGVFQQDPADSTQNCRSMLISLSEAETHLGFAAQAVEFGQVGGLTDVQTDHDLVQTALETGGVRAGIEALENIEAQRAIVDLEAEPPHTPSLEIS